MSARKLVSLVVALLVASLAAGCGAFARQPPAKQRFVLAPGVPTADPGSRLATVLRVDLVRGSPFVVNRGFVYQTRRDTVVSDFYNEFYAPPGVLVRDALVEWLRGTGRFEAVVRSSEAPSQWILEADLERMLADVEDPAAATAQLDLVLRLLDARAGDPRLVFSTRYVESEPAATREPQALVDAWSRALGRVLAEVASDTTAAIAAAAKPPR